jgi:hypothetical protein
MKKIAKFAINVVANYIERALHCQYPISALLRPLTCHDSSEAIAQFYRQDSYVACAVSKECGSDLRGVTRGGCLSL